MGESARPCVTVVGLGPGGQGDLTLAALQSMKDASVVVVRTSQHPTVMELHRQGIVFDSFDDLYLEADDFEALYREMVARIVSMAQEAFGKTPRGEVVYAVPGSPHVGERSVELLIEVADQAGIDVKILPGVSFLEPLCSEAQIGLFNGLQVVDALSIEGISLNTSVDLAIPQVYDRMVAARVKSRLLQVYPDEHRVLMVRAARTVGERLQRMCLYEIDRAEDIDHLTTLVIPSLQSRIDTCGFERAATAFAELVSVMSRLRSDDGCPWDREQTHRSLAKYMIEETYEALDTIDKDDMEKLCEELGDVMLQVVFHAQIADENHDFDIADVAETIVEKMMRRHPHVFGETQVDGTDAVLRNWEKIKAVERGEKDRFSGVFDSVPVALPALMRAEIVQSKASKVGFDWNDFRPALDKVQEEIEELREALDEHGGSLTQEHLDASVIEELGDLLFAVVNVSRLLGIDPEAALKKTVDKFISRFKYIEKKASEGGVSIHDMTLKEMDRLWEESKGV